MEKWKEVNNYTVKDGVTREELISDNNDETNFNEDYNHQTRLFVPLNC